MGSILGSLLLDLLKSAIEKKITAAKERREYNAFLTDIDNWCNDFINKNETTVVATTTFSDYINCYNLVEHLINFIEQPVNQTEESFITECNENAKTYLKERRVLTPDDTRCIKEFINGIFEKTKRFYEKMLPANLTSLYYETKQSNGLLGELKSDVQEIKERILPQNATVIKKEYSCPTNTITRKLALYKNIQECSFLLHSEDMLDVCFREKHIVLLGEAGCGKTIALQQLASMINATEYFPLRYDLNDYIDESIEQIIAQVYQDVEYNKLFLIFDAYDEIQEKSRNDFARRINRFVSNNPNTIVVVSSRNNFYKFANDNGEGGLFRGFKEYGIASITSDDRLKYIESNGISGKSFYCKIEKKALYDLITTPFYLKELIGIYLKQHTLPSKADLMETIIRNRFAEDCQKYATTKSIENYEDELFTNLQKLAFAIQCMQSIQITNEEYQRLIERSDIRELIGYSGVFSKGTEGKWAFDHNNFREYLAAKYINGFTLVDITNLICTSDNKVFDSWLNVLSFLVLIRKENDLLNYLVENDPEMIVRFERNRVEEQIRNEIVIKILDSYAQKNIWLSHGVNSPELIAQFGQSQKLCEYLIGQIASPVNFRAQSNALSVLSEFTELYGMDEKIRETLFETLKSEDVRCYEKQKILDALVSLGLQTDEITEYVVKSYSKDDDPSYRSGILKYLDESNLYEKYIDIFVQEYELSEHYFRDGTSIRYEVLDVFAKVKGAFAICKVIISLGKHKDMYSYDEEKQGVVFSNAIAIYKNGNKEVYDAILKVFAESELHNHTFFKESIDFFEKTGTKIDAFMRLVNFDIDVVSYQTMPIISQIADESCYLHLLSKYQESPDQYGKFVERLTLYFGEDSAIYARYKEALLQNGITLPKREVRLDWEKARQKARQQYFNCLFDQKEYCELVRKFLQSIGKDHLLFSELKSVAVPSFEHVDESNIVEKYAMQQMYHRLSSYTDDTDIYNTLETLSDWENFITTESYKILDIDSTLEISLAQKTFFENYCRKQLQTLDFQKEIWDDNEGQTRDAYRLIKFIFFSELFDFQYEKEVYLKMLFVPAHFFKSGEEHPGKFPLYVVNKLSPIEFQEGVKRNLSGESMSLDAWDMHIRFCRDNNLDWGVSSAIEICQRKSTDSWRKRLCIEYIEQVKGYEFVYSVFLETDDNDVIESIISTTQKYKDNRLKERLEYLSKHSGEENRYLSTLIMLNSKYALQQYIKIAGKAMKASENVSDSEWIDPQIEAISAVRETDLLDEIDQLRDLLFLPDFQDKEHFGLYNSLFKAYENMARANPILVKQHLVEALERETVSEDEKNFCNTLIVSIERTGKQKNDVAWTIDEIRSFWKAHKG